MTAQPSSAPSSTASWAGPQSAPGHDSTVFVPDSAAPRILVVEDDGDFRSQLGDYFAYLQWDAVLARSCDEAVAGFKQGPVDLVLCDVMLPGADGFTTVKTLRALRGGEAVPVVMISAVWRDPSRFRSQLEDIGAVEFLRKPLSILELGQRIGAILRAPDALIRGGAATRSGQFRNLGVDAMVRKTLTPLQTLGSYRPAVLIDLFVTLFEQRRSGLLVLTGDDGRREIGFLDGYPVQAETDEPAEMLSAVLMDEGSIAPSDVPRLLAAQRELKRPLRELVVERGIVGAEAALAAEQRRVRRVLLGAFGGYGDFEFLEGEEMVVRAGRFELHPIPLLQRVIRDIPLREFGGELGKRSTQLLVPGAHHRRLHAELALPPELDWLDAAMANGLAIKDLLAAGDHPEQLLKTVWLLVRLGIADTVDDATRPSQAEGPVRGRPPSLVVDTSPEIEILGDRARELLRDYLWLVDADCYRVLDVPHHANDVEIEAAWKGRAARWRAVALSEEPARVRVKATELLERLADARDLLTDPARRERYDRRLIAGLAHTVREGTATQRLALAREALQQGRHPDAIAAYRLLLREHAGSVEVLTGLGLALCRHRYVAGPAALAEARELLARAVARQPDDVRVLRQHAEVLDAAGDRVGLRRTRERLTELESTGNWPRVRG